MRRKDRRIEDQARIEAIIAHGRVCRLALQDLPAPYIVPLSFGYRQKTLYFHAAREGHKIDLIRHNPRAGFEISIDLGAVDGGERGCDWSVRYRSVVGYGTVSFVESTAEKRVALDSIMAQYAEGKFSYQEATLDRTLVFKLEIETMTGKASDA